MALIVMVRTSRLFYSSGQRQTRRPSSRQADLRRESRQARTETRDSIELDPNAGPLGRPGALRRDTVLLLDEQIAAGVDSLVYSASPTSLDTNLRARSSSTSIARSRDNRCRS